MDKEKKQDIRYYIVIPSDVLLNEKLSDKSKILFGIISNLLNREGFCYATNDYFEQILNCSTRTIQRSLEELEENKLIFIYIEKNAKGTYRKIYTRETKTKETKNFYESKMSYGDGQKCHTKRKFKQNKNK